MDCSATELLEEIEPQHERRRAPRQTFITKGMIYREDGQSGPRRIVLKNLSVLGVGFESTEPIEPGTRCRIRIEAGPTQINWRLQVVCCGKIDDGSYRLGGQFVPAELERDVPRNLQPQSSSAAPEAQLTLVLPPDESAMPIQPRSSTAPQKSPAADPLPLSPPEPPAMRHRAARAEKSESSSFIL